MAVEVPDDMLVPGDTIAFDYELLTTQPEMKSWAAGKIKEAIAQHELLDYLGSREYSVGDLERKRDVTILRVFAQVRRTARATRVPVQEASLVHVLAGIGAATMVVATYLLLKGGTKYLGATVEKANETMENLFDLGVLLLLGFVAVYLFAK